MASPRSHLPELAAFNALAVLLVVLGHSVPVRDSLPDAAAHGFIGLVDLIYRFHMPLFWWAAGYLYLHTNPADTPRRWSQLIRQKALRLLVPYWALSTLAFPIKAALAAQALRPVNYSLGSYLETLFYPWLNTIIYYWFLPTLFLAFLVAPVLRWLLLRGSTAVTVAVSLGLLALNLTQETAFHDLLNYRGLLRDLWVFWLGMLGCHHRDRLRGLASPWAGAGAAVVLLALHFAGLPTSGHRFNWAGTAGALAGIGACWALANQLHRVAWLPWAALHHGAFTIYLLSWFPQIFFKLVCWQQLKLWWLAAGLMFAGGLLLPLLGARLVERWAPWLLYVIGSERRRPAVQTEAASTRR